MGFKLDLGSLSLTIPKCHYQLHASSCVTGSLQGEELLLAQSFESLLESSSVWKCRGQGLQLVVHFNLHDPVLRKGLARSFANALVVAKLWEQLRLAPCLEGVHEDFGDEESYISSVFITLKHKQSDNAIARPKLHRIWNGVPFSDVQPPSSTSVVGLESVHVSLSFMKRQESRKTNSFAEEPGNYHHGEMPQTKGKYEPLAEDLDDEMLETNEDLEREPPLTDHASMPFEDSQKNEINQVQLGRLFALADTAFRMVMCSRPTRKERGIKVVRDDRKFQLDDIAPCLWSPDYLPAVAQRACFISTISTALSRSLARAAKFSGLSRSRETLISRFSNARLTTDELQSIERIEEEVKGCVDTKLWDMLQEAMRNKALANRLDQLEFQPDSWVDAIAGSGEDITIDNFHEDEVDGVGTKGLTLDTNDEVEPTESPESIVFSSSPIADEDMVSQCLESPENFVHDKVLDDNFDRAGSSIIESIDFHDISTEFLEDVSDFASDTIDDIPDHVDGDESPHLDSWMSNDRTFATGDNVITEENSFSFCNGISEAESICL